jgi:hypothetical protein
MADYDVIHKIERQMAADRERVRELIKREGTADDLDFYDQSMRDLDRGITQARNAWHSLSDAQQRVLAFLATDTVKLTKRVDSKVYDANTGRETIERVATLATIRAMAARELVQWEGGAFDPESIVSLTERGRFVVDKGRPDKAS